MPGGSHATKPGRDVSMATGGLHPAPSAILQPGTVVAQTYRVERVLGSGAMGMVVLATHLALDRKVALKVHRAHNPGDIARLAREAKALAKVDHPNVVGIYDVREAEGSLFIAMEYIEGSSARQWLTQSAMTWRSRLEACLQAAEGLSAAHAAGLVHRDFKPENILVGRDGRVVVADFGLARAPGAVPIDPETPSPGIDAQLTADGAIAGTPAYMAPEQWSGGSVDGRTDVFALSVVVYEALYGHRPFAGSTPAELVYAVTRGMILEPPRETEVPSPVFDVLRRGMAVEPQGRFASVAMLTRALKNALGAQGRTGIALAIGLAALVFGGLAAGAWALRTADEADDVEQASVLLLEAEDAQDVSPEPALVTPQPVPPAAEPGSERSPEPPAPVEPVVPTPDPTERFAELSDRYAAGKASVDELIDGVQDLHEAQRQPAEGRYVRTPWDGRSTFRCGMGDRVELRDVDAKIEHGPAITMQLGCALKLVDVDIEAPVAIEGQGGDRLVIDGGTFTVSRTGINLQMLAVDLRNLTIEGEPKLGASFGMHTVGTITDCTFSGATALQVGMHADLDVDGGTLRGMTAIKAKMLSSVRLENVALDGKVDRDPKSRVER